MERGQAKLLGLEFYDTGRPCIRGHLSARNTKHGTCLACRTERNNEYYAANQEKEKCRTARYREENPEKAKQSTINWKNNNKEKQAAILHEYWESNKDRLSLRRKERYQQGKDRENELARKWKNENKERATFLNAKRNAAKLRAIPLWANMDKVQSIYNEAARKTKETGAQYHVDHIFPLQSKHVCGLHCEHNLQIIPGIENLKKGNRHWPGMPEQRSSI